MDRFDILTNHTNRLRIRLFVCCVRGVRQSVVALRLWKWVALSLLVTGCAQGTSIEPRIPSDMAMMMAEVAPMPTRSPDQRLDGILVADIRVAATGDVTRVMILESPPAADTLRLSDALSKWRFEPLPDGSGGSPQPFVTKLMFWYDSGTMRFSNLSIWRRDASAVTGRALPEKIDGPARAILLLSDDTVLLDINERSIYRKTTRHATNIPFDELSKRRETLALQHAANGDSLTVIIDCYGPAISKCGSAAELLNATGGIRRVFISQ